MWGLNGPVRTDTARIPDLYTHMAFFSIESDFAYRLVKSRNSIPPYAFNKFDAPISALSPVFRAGRDHPIFFCIWPISQCKAKNPETGRADRDAINRAYGRAYNNTLLLYIL